MKKKEADKLLLKASYLLEQTITLKNPNSIPPLKEEQYLVESFGAAKIYFGSSNSIKWYEVWANLKNVKTGKMHKMFLQLLINIFPNNKISN
ncbi:hypothetical protein [Flavobacterium sp. UBA7680]|uniref:hypothetical protein n=1 Tax=Flavobacterium sp. UBA7680 TaxID=1946559 RepID=UPI0025B90F8C|nr:hypothetical protein [Flavobacterium sp. UBA7680]